MKLPMKNGEEGDYVVMSLKHHLMKRKKHLATCISTAVRSKDYIKKKMGRKKLGTIVLEKVTFWMTYNSSSLLLPISLSVLHSFYNLKNIFLKIKNKANCPKLSLLFICPASPLLVFSLSLALS